MLEVNFRKKLWHFHVEFELELGNQVLVLWGPSGAGKTTILHCLAGLVKPCQGSIILNNRVLYSSTDNINVATRNRNIAYLFQNYALFP
ncbi:MAG: ATP-binding cassette domain-containing protein, partial [Syntrophomonadaceae bacterium]|nr:ATP-binding cassette domain-containing protein [Syntrophomonadaceae bacterium]